MPREKRAAQEGQGRCTSDSLEEGAGQRAAYSYQLFKHIPLHTEMYKPDSVETLGEITKNQAGQA